VNKHLYLCHLLVLSSPTFIHIFLPWVYFKLTYNLHYRSVISNDSKVYLSALINRLNPSGKHVYLLIRHMKLYILPTRCNYICTWRRCFLLSEVETDFLCYLDEFQSSKERSLIFCLPVWTCLNILRNEFYFVKLIAQAGFDK